MIKYVDNFTKQKLDSIRKDLNKKYRYNLFEHVMELLRISKNTYGILLTRGKGDIINLNRMEDERLTKLGKEKTGIFLPPNNLDAYIEIDINLKYVDFQTQQLSVNIINIIFHELFEAYMMLDAEMQYQEAHDYVGIQELALMNQISHLSEYIAFGKVTRDKRYS